MVCYIDVKFFLYYLLASQSSGEVRSPNLLVNPNDFLADSDTDALFGYVFLYCKNVVIVVNLKSLLEHTFLPAFTHFFLHKLFWSVWVCVSYA